jgi:transposase, IS5 family
VLHEIASMRQFSRLSLLAAIPDETTILNFRHPLELHGVTARLLEAVNCRVQGKGLLLRLGTIIDAPSSTKNRSNAREPEMQQATKDNQWVFGMKAHIGVDRDSGLVHTGVSTATVPQSDALLHDYRCRLYRRHKREASQDKKMRWNIAECRNRIKVLAEGELKGVREFIEYLIAKLRSKVEHPFRVIKRQSGYTKARYRGLAKSGAQVATLFALSNLGMARKRLLAMKGKVRPQRRRSVALGQFRPEMA